MARIEVKGQLMRGGTLEEMADAAGIERGREVEMVEKDYLRDVLIAVLRDESFVGKLCAITEIAAAVGIESLK